MLTKEKLTIKPAVPSPSRDPGGYGSKEYDLTGHIGPLWPQITEASPWPMYSFERPATILWNAIAKRLFESGWTDAQIKEWLQSKSPRYALDGPLGDAIERLGTEYADKMLMGD